MSDKQHTTAAEHPRSIPFSMIEADTDFNIRTLYGSDIQDLADSIQSEGLQTPLCVMKNGGEKYKLVSGFRRYMAMKSLKWGQKPVDIIVREFKSPGKSYLANIAENTARKDVSTHDQARRFYQLETGDFSQGAETGDDSEEDKKLREEAKKGVRLERKEIALATSLSAAHIGNLVRAYKNLSKDSKSVWQKGFMAGGKRHELPITFVFTLARTEDNGPLNDAQQEKELAAFIEAREEELAENGGKRKRKNKKDEDDVAFKVTKKEIRETYEKLIAKGEEGSLKGLDKAFLDGKIQALRFVLGDISSRGVTPTAYAK